MLNSNHTRRPAFADRTTHCQFQATGQPVSRTQASDAMTSRLPHYEAKYVCNVGASNAGWSLCIQMSRERSYPLPIYWYQSKGNWLHYNFATDSFWATVCKTVRPMLSVHCVSCLSCPVCLSVCLWRSCTVAKRLDGSRRNVACR